MDKFQIIQKKLTAAIFLFVIFAVLMFTSFTGKRHSDQMSEAAGSIYKDRLVVESYIFGFYRHLHHIKETIDDGRISENARKLVIEKELQGLRKIHGLYFRTVLTPDESAYLETFENNIQSLSDAAQSGNWTIASGFSLQNLELLDALSAIQLAEGKAQMENVDRISSSSGLFSQLEMGMLIVIALIIQALVFSSRRLSDIKSDTRMSLN